MSPLSKNQRAIVFLLDENVDVRISSFLKNKDYPVSIVPAGIRNGEVITLAKKENSILLTNDKDFANPLLYSNLQSAGIVVFHIHPPDVHKLTSALEHLLAKLAPEHMRGKITLVEENGYTILT